LSESFRQTYSLDSNGEAQVTGRSLDEKTAAPDNKPPAPLGRTGGAPSSTRTVVNSETGETKFQHGATRTHTTPPVAPDPNAVTVMTAEGGYRTTLSEAGPKDIVDLGGSLGNAQVDTWVRLGYLQRDPVNGGYKRVGEVTPNQPNADKPAAPPASNTQAKNDAPADPALLSGVKGSSEASDQIITKLTSAAPMVIEQMITEAARGTDINYDAIGERLKDETAPARFEKAVAEHREAGATVLRNMNIDPVVFENHIRATNPELADTIVRDVFVNKSMASLIKAGREYAQDRAERISRHAEDAGVKTMISKGQVFFDRAGLGLSPYAGGGDFRSTWISEAEAKRLGKLEISE